MGAPRKECPNETQERFLELLSASPRPLRSVELREHLGLLESEMTGAYRWLWQHDYIVRYLKVVKSAGGHRTHAMRVAFWTLSAKGAQHVAQKRNPLAPSVRETPLM